MANRLPQSDADRQWLTPAKGMVITLAALVASLAIVVSTFLVPVLAEHLATRQYRTGWLPQPEEVLAVKVSWREPVGDDAKWVTQELPVESASPILDCFVNRITDDEYWKKHPSPRGILVEPDFFEAFRIEMTIEDARPVLISGTRWGLVWVGEKGFVLPRDDFRRLQDIVFSERNKSQ